MKRKCIKCKCESVLPLCDECRKSLKSFSALTEYLNYLWSNHVCKEDLLWIIESEIVDRRSKIINMCKVVLEPEKGIINMVPIEPSAYTLEEKPWLRRRYLSVRQKIDEIAALNRACKIVRGQHDRQRNQKS